ncbi:thermonuclease family protein [Geomonas sp. RF6]|nr:thermonuclease family protein [Geomonas sp. RF6]UFS72783.1 thermonuclease family protein [Geomonas sp. RF6]
MHCTLRKSHNRAVLALFLLFFLIPFTAVHAQPPVRSLAGFVIKVADGDTITVIDSLGTKVRVRLYGIDAPEIEKINKRTDRISKPGQPYGDEAWKALSGKILRQSVKLDVIAVDLYRRLVCLVWLGSRNINQEMVAEGWAWAYRDYLETPYASEFIDAEVRARNSKLGLWQGVNQLPPWEFRRLGKNEKIK